LESLEIVIVGMRDIPRDKDKKQKAQENNNFGGL